MPRRKPKPANSWSMYPDLHDEVAAELGKNNLVFGFYNNDDDSSAVEDYDTNIMGRFQCYNSSCSTNGWSSKKIAISIRMYSGNRKKRQIDRGEYKTSTDPMMCQSP
ncbi:zinc-binding domain-containing [Fusarium albosuccineum]|uniref:Zinc-binding domain-containing n=1 Tax=Fusarium albosuccineum TaxID=1237068 RepID=A0A8H4PGY7_9HYPO|nr:zinc-binding domain-containing [Fusarium albosuccineum]